MAVTWSTSPGAVSMTALAAAAPVAASRTVTLASAGKHTPAAGQEHQESAVNARG